MQGYEKHEVPITQTVITYKAPCDLCSNIASELTEAEYKEAQARDQDPVVSIYFEEEPTFLLHLCDNCRAFVEDRIDEILNPIRGARRYTGQKPTEPPTDAPDPDTTTGEGVAEDRSESGGDVGS